MKIENLTGKRVLFICPLFHEYPIKIKAAIESLHAKVDLFYVNKKNVLSTILLNISNTFLAKYRRYQQHKILEQIENTNYDYVFIQHPLFLEHDVILTLKTRNPKSIFVGYFWDSIDEKNYLGYYQYFDRIFSFDRKDCEKYKKLIYLPLFFTNDFNIKFQKPAKFDISFIGGIGDSENRYEFIKSMEKICLESGLRFYSYLYISLNFYLKSLLKGKRYKGVRLRKIHLKDIAAVYSASNCIVDYHNPKQNGLTMRTFEGMGSGCKLLTTNKNIVHEPFFNDSMIKIIDKEDLNFDLSFVDQKDKTSINIESYSIDNWIKNILFV